MNDQTGGALLRNAIKIAPGQDILPGDRTIDTASLPRNPFRDLDRETAAALARMTGGLSPVALWLAYSDWAMHLGAAPGRQLELALDIWQDRTRLFSVITSRYGSGVWITPVRPLQTTKSLSYDETPLNTSSSAKG